MKRRDRNIKHEKNYTGRASGILPFSADAKQPQANAVVMENCNRDKLRRNTTYYGKSSVINSDLKVLKLPTTAASTSAPKECRLSV